MITNNENTWGEDTNDQTQGYGSTSFGTPNNGDTTNNYSSDDIADEDDDLIADDDDLETEDLDAEDDDLEADYEETNLDDTEGGGITTGVYSSADSDATNPDEFPEEGESDDEGSGYTEQTEQQQQQGGNDTSYSEQTDVTPPNQHEFPSTGSPQTDFASRNQGRTTGRMVGHEPGTEGI